MLSAGDSLGVFQSESPGMRQLLRGLKVRGRRDLAIALSLIRPGPASGGMKNEFIERHVHGKPFQYLHPKIAGLLGDTYGVMLYQEDVMRIAVEVAGYTVAEADRFQHGAPVEGVDLQGNPVALETTRPGVEPQLGHLRYLLHTNNDLHRRPRRCMVF